MLLNLLTLLFCLQADTIPANPYAPLQRIDIKVTPWQKRQALIYTPQENVPGKKYPLLICFHGRSIAGKDPAKILKEGVTRQIKEGRMIEAVNKVDGKLYKFIVVAPLESSWSFLPQNVEPLIDDLLKRYPVDPTRIYMTGYSAGGWSVESAKTHNASLTNRIAAAVTMSPAITETAYLKRYKLVADANLHTWFFAGDKDGYFLKNIHTFIDSTNHYKRGLTRITIYEGGHCCWHTFYNPKYKDQGMSIYEWMLQYQKK